MGRRLRNLKRSLNCFRTTSEVLVFESDDWGTDGMPSRRAYEELAAEGIIDTADSFNRCGRETIEDLDMLYNVLAEFHDHTGRPPVLTTNFVVANPDFTAIEASGYRDYSWIAIDDVDRRPWQAPLIAKYKEGIERGLIYPQYHGRDHFSAELWLQALRLGDPVAEAGFRRRVPMSGDSRFLQAEYLECRDHSARPLPQDSIDAKTEIGVGIFECTFGFRPLTSIAPFYMWCDAVEASLYQHGVRCMQAAGHRLSPCNQNSQLCREPGILGERSESGIIYLTRNCWFRPSEVGEGALEVCLREIASAFARGYPVVIDTHRVNYVGVIEPGMRDANLALLRDLLETIVRRFPRVRFATSAELASSLLSEDGQCRERGEPDLLIPRASSSRRAAYAARERYEWWLAKKQSRERQEDLRNTVGG